MSKSNNEIKNILDLAEKERLNLKHPYVGSEHLFLALIKTNNSLSEYLKKYNLIYDDFKKELINVVGSCSKSSSTNLYTPLLRKIIKRYEQKSEHTGSIYEELFLSLLDEGEGIAIIIMLKMNIDLDEIYFELREKQKLNHMEVSNKIGILLNKEININEKVIGREEELKKVILSLTRKKKCNPILIGPAGVGKTAIVEELTRRIIKGEVPDSLKVYKVFMIEMGSLISCTKYRGEFEERLNKIIKEILNDNKTIIFIDEIHSMINAGGAEGAINAADILKPYLARGSIKCIGATTTSEYNNCILKDKALARRFDVINIKEPDENKMIELLSAVKKEYEEFHDIKISLPVIKQIVKLSDYYLKNISNPDKSIDLLDSSCAYAKINGDKKNLTENDILNTIFYKTNNCLINNKSFINRLKNNLLKIVDRKDINKILSIFSLNNKSPISILLNSDELENIIKDNLKNINIITIDLDSYTNINQCTFTQDKLITETVFNSMVDKPFSLILFHNVDSANNSILNEIAKINKEGVISFKYDEKLYFNNAVVIASLKKSSLVTAGFSKTTIKSKLPSNFVSSFQIDIRDLKTKEMTS